MSMHFLQSELRKTGNPGDLAVAEILASHLDDRGEDIPLPTSKSIEPKAKLGFIALRTPETEFLATPNEVLELRETNTQQLMHRIQTLTLPYEDLLKEKAGADRAKRIEGTRLPFYFNRDRKLEWGERLLAGDKYCDYSFSMKYAEKDNFAELQSVKMGVDSRNFGLFSLGLGFENEKISQVSLEWSNRSSLINAITKNKQLGHLVELCSDSGNDGIKKDVLELQRRIVFDTSSRSLDLMSEVYYSNRIPVHSSLVYDGDKDTFVGRDMAIDGSPAKMTNEDALQILEDLLSLVPTVEY